jgi:hypothetical protein
VSSRRRSKVQASLELNSTVLLDLASEILL